MTGVRKIAPDERVEGQPTPGMRRETAVETANLWTGYATTDPRMTSGWHHHGQYESSIYVLSGRLRMEFGPGGTEVLNAGPGDFLFVERMAIHREGNPSDEPGHIVVTRAGTGPAVINVEGPEPA
jgi:uncharacterized RmlC-like cupin family protein